MFFPIISPPIEPLAREGGRTCKVTAQALKPMKKMIRYFKIFGHPLYVPALIIITFVLSFTLLLFFSNAEISSYAARVIDGQGDYVLPISLTLSKMDEKAGEAILSMPNIRSFRWSSSSEEEDHLTILAGGQYLSPKLMKKLEDNSDGVIGPPGYQRVTGKDRFVIEGKEFRIIGEDDRDITYSEDSPIRIYLEPHAFAKLGLSHVSVDLYLEGLPSGKEMRSIVKDLENQGLTIDEVRIPDFENGLMVGRKGSILLYLMILFLFIGLNILAIFNYVLSTRQKGLSILRTFGLSRKKGASLIATEMMTYSFLASLIVLIIFFLVIHQLSEYFVFTDALIFLLLANIVIWLATKVMAGVVLSRPLGILIKENWNE